MRRKYTAIVELPDDYEPRFDWQQVKALTPAEAADLAKVLVKERHPDPDTLTIDDIAVVAVIVGWPELEFDPYAGRDLLDEPDY